MNVDNVAASSKIINGILVGAEGQVVDVADDVSPPPLRSRSKSSSAKRVIVELDNIMR